MPRELCLLLNKNMEIVSYHIAKAGKIRGKERDRIMQQTALNCLIQSPEMECCELTFISISCGEYMADDMIRKLDKSNLGKIMYSKSISKSEEEKTRCDEMIKKYDINMDNYKLTAEDASPYCFPTKMITGIVKNNFVQNKNICELTRTNPQVIIAINMEITYEEAGEIIKNQEIP